MIFYADKFASGGDSQKDLACRLKGSANLFLVLLFDVECLFLSLSVLYDQYMKINSFAGVDC